MVSITRNSKNIVLVLRMGQKKCLGNRIYRLLRAIARFINMIRVNRL